MFVSSYNTYIGTNASDKNDRYKTKIAGADAESFGKELSKLPILESHINRNMPIDYVSNYKSFNNQQKLHEELKSQDELKLKELNTVTSAKVAYEENSKMFPLLRRPSLTLSQTPKILDEKLPRDAQEAKERSLRHVMVNTYLANDNYYRITAA